MTRTGGVGKNDRIENGANGNGDGEDKGRPICYSINVIVIEGC